MQDDTVSEAITGDSPQPESRLPPQIAAVEASHKTVGDITAASPVIQARNVDVFYGETHALQDISLDIGLNEVIALIGPSGCGKSTFIRCLNRMNDTIDSARVTGSILLDGEDIYTRKMDVVMLRARVGIVFQKPNPFPKSIYDNVAYGPRIHGLARHRAELDKIVQTSLERAGLWSEVKNRLEEPGTGLSGGQQQRLCIARTIAVDPEVILMDMSLPVIDGWEESRQIKSIEATKDIPIIALTAHAMASDREKALEAGCDDYDTKPVDLDRLLSKIDKAVST